MPNRRVDEPNSPAAAEVANRLVASQAEISKQVGTIQGSEGAQE